MLLRPDPEVVRTRETTRSVARTFALACRLLPRGVRDDVYRLYLVFRTLDDLVDTGDPRAEARITAVETSDPPPPRRGQVRTSHTALGADGLLRGNAL